MCYFLPFALNDLISTNWQVPCICKNYVYHSRHTLVLIWVYSTHWHSCLCVCASPMIGTHPIGSVVNGKHWLPAYLSLSINILKTIFAIKLAIAIVSRHKRVWCCEYEFCIYYLLHFFHVVIRVFVCILYLPSPALYTGKLVFAASMDCVWHEC